MSGAAAASRLDGMTGDFLPRRQKASVRAQVVTVVVLLTIAVVAMYAFF